MLLRSTSLAVIACLLVACAIPKRAVVVDEPKHNKPTHPAASETQKPPTRESPPNPVPDDGFRTGDMLALPKESEYRPTNPSLPKPNPNSGTVIVSPPKPKTEESKQ